MAIFFDFLFLIKHRNIMHLRIKNLIKNLHKNTGLKAGFFSFCLSADILFLNFLSRPTFSVLVSAAGFRL